jgi:hypothetical protein
MAMMIPGDIEFGTEGEKAIYPGSGKQRRLAGMSPRLGVRPMSPVLPVGLHKFLEGVAKPVGFVGLLSSLGLSGRRVHWVIELLGY